jgi:hypothetical protein
MTPRRRSPSRRRRRNTRRGGHYEGEVRHYEDEVVEGDRSASGSASSCQYRTSHLICPPVAPHEDNRVVIVPSSDT